MLGAGSFSEFPLATQGIVVTGSESLDANFTQTSSAIYLASGSLDLIGTSSKASIGVGVLAGVMNAVAEFSTAGQIGWGGDAWGFNGFGLDSDIKGILLANGVSVQDFSFTQDSAGERITLGDISLSAEFEQIVNGIRVQPASLDMSADFTVDAAAILIAAGILDLETNTIQETIARRVLLGSETLEFSFSQETNSIRLRTATAEMEFDTVQTTAGNSIFSGESAIIGVFVQTTDGELLWVEIDAGTSAEAWAAITHTGDVWTEINASSTEENWTEVTHTGDSWTEIVPADDETWTEKVV